MSTGALIAFGGAALLSAGATYYSYEGQKEMARQQEKEAERQAGIEKERAEREERLEQERIEYEANLAREQAEWETAISLEKAEFTAERVQEEANIVLAAQRAGYAAAGLAIEGSPLTVITRTAKEATTERERVIRGHEIFAEARSKEAAEVAKGGATAFEWFKTRLHAETGYAVESRYKEAQMYRTKGRLAETGMWLGTGASLLGGYAKYKKFQMSLA